MQQTMTAWLVERKEIRSLALEKSVTVDFYLPTNITQPERLSLLLINDGQNLEEMNFIALLEELTGSGKTDPFICAGVHAGADRKMEYGTANQLDYMGRGAHSGAYQQFLVTELLPFIRKNYRIAEFRMRAVAGFSLGGLSAIDTVWNHPGLFSIAGIFSGSLWWRSKDLESYNEETDRIMHRQIREGNYVSYLRFYFTTGSLDETADRNNNGIIDSIDDTLGLIDVLKEKGYTDKDLYYGNFEDGRHDVATWARAMPHFLEWAFGTKDR